MDLALNNLQRLICHKTQTTNQATFFSFFFFLVLLSNFISDWLLSRGLPFSLSFSGQEILLKLHIVLFSFFPHPFFFFFSETSPRVAFRLQNRLTWTEAEDPVASRDELELLHVESDSPPPLTNCFENLRKS